MVSLQFAPSDMSPCQGWKAPKLHFLEGGTLGKETDGLDGKENKMSLPTLILLKFSIGTPESQKWNPDIPGRKRQGCH